jgi:hypothetical protein
VERLINEIELSQPWEHIEAEWPDPMSFFARQPEYKTLHALMTDWVSKSARLLWYRTHHFVYA